MIIYPNAKINIGLNVTEKRADGYHNLETVFYPIELLDVIELTESSEFAIKVTGNALDGTPEDNLVTKAYRMLAAEYQFSPLMIHLHKHIPTGAGLGGEVQTQHSRSRPSTTSSTSDFRTARWKSMLHA